MRSVLAIVVLPLVLAGWVLALPPAPVLAQGTLSEQVLQLLVRDNTWTGTQTFQDSRLTCAAVPSTTADRFYCDLSGNLYFDGTLLIASGGTTAPHNLLSTTHPDTLPSTVVRGGVVVGNSTPAWAQVAVGAAGTVFRSDGTDPGWSTDGSALTALNASNLASGTVALARLPTTIANAQIDAAAAIAWTKISKSGSSLADLATRSAADLSTGTLADARLSSLVSLFGAAVDTAEIANGAVTAVKIANIGCTAGQALTYQLAGWACGTFGTGSGSVTSVALSLPAIFSVTGSPVTASGTLTAALATQTANTIWAGPTTGAAASPTFRALVAADLPTSGVAAGTYVKVTLNTQGVATAASAILDLAADVGATILPFANGGTGLAAAADDTTLVSSGSAWVARTLPNCTTTPLGYTQATNLFSCLTSLSLTTLTVSGATTLNDELTVENGASISRIIVSADNNIGKLVSWRTANVQRWAIRVDGNETGSDAGGNWALRAYVDAGTLLDSPITITRAAGGAIVTNRPVTLTDGAKFSAAGDTLVGVFTGTTTYDPGAVSDQTSVTTTLTVTGAAVGQTCEAALSTVDAENLLVSAFPSGANTVRVVVGNLSGGPLSPGSGTLRATCTAF